jgi:hypothetical protein
MTQVQASNPSQEFLVAVRINADNTYQGNALPGTATTVIVFASHAS